MGIRYEKQYEINYYDVDFKFRCKVTSMMNFFGDIGTRQSEELGVGLDFLKEINATWVFYKYDINVIKYPKYGNKIKIITEITGFKKFYAYRDYLILDENGQILVKATALFFLIDIDKRRPVRIPKDQYNIYGIEDDLQTSIEMENIDKLTEIHNSSEFRVRYSDIDTNRHVNNVKYLEWAIEMVPLEVVKNYKLSRVKITFERELTYANSVTSNIQVIKVSDNEIKCLHKIQNEHRTEVNILETIWNLLN